MDTKGRAGDDTLGTHTDEYRVLVSLGLTDFVRQVPYPVLIVTPLTHNGKAPPLLNFQLEAGTDAVDSSQMRGPSLDRALVLPVHKKPGSAEPSIWLGRASNCDVILPFEGISRVHSVIRRSASNDYLIGDVSSKNGTYLNGEQLEGGRLYPLPDDALVMFADLEVTFLFPETFYGELLRNTF
jgi:hypothetical protein